MIAKCAACPLQGSETPCPAHWDWSEYCGHASTGNAYWVGEILKKAGSYRPTPRVNGFFPQARPHDGRIRVGVVSPCCFTGGAERWISDLFDLCDGSQLRWEGVAIRIEMGPNPGPNLLDDWKQHCPVAIGLDAVQQLAQRVDVLLTWGVVDLPWGISGDEMDRLVPPAVPMITVSHGSLEYAGDDTKFTRAIPAACSRAAVRGLPVSKRPNAKIILNAIPERRVEVQTSIASTRAGWNVRAGSNVAGYLGRIMTDKGFLHFVEGVAALPNSWHGVMVGDGLGLEHAQSRARELGISERITFAGHREDVGNVLAALDCLVMPSPSEACCLAAAEGWLAGVPLISTQVGLLEDHPGLARLIPNPPQPEDIARAVLADVADSEGTRERITTAREFVRTNLSADRFGQEWTQFLLKVARPTINEQHQRNKAMRECAYRVPPSCGCSQVAAICNRPDQLGKQVWSQDCHACVKAGMNTPHTELEVAHG